MGSTLSAEYWGIEFDKELSDEQWTRYSNAADGCYDPRIEDYDIDRCIVLAERVVPGISVVKQVAFPRHGVRFSEL